MADQEIVTDESTAPAPDGAAHTDRIAGVVPASPDSTAGADPDPRRMALRHAYELIRSVQDRTPLSAADVERVIADAERRGWPDVVRIGLFLAVVRSACEHGEPDAAAIARLLDRAQSDGDPTTTALGLALRAQKPGSGGDWVVADRDLARASVTLEIDGDPSLARASAHIECASAYGMRDLWELVLAHYDAAEAALATDPDKDLVLPVILYNRAEFQLDWCAALRELGDAPALAARAHLARQALAEADVPALPDSWREELRIFALLLAAIAPDPHSPPPAPVIAAGSYEGYVHLAHALTMEAGPAAQLAVENAVRLIDDDLSPHVRSLALCIAAETEAALAGGETAGLRYAKRLVAMRWATRLSSLAAMQSLLEAESIRGEHELLSRHAYLDDLTHLGNRRALLRHLGTMATRGVTEVAVVLVDLDHFKVVNDTHGHEVGDRTLVRVADILRGAVRTEDLAVRLGGDEFLLVLASTPLEAALDRAATIVHAIAAQDWQQIAAGLRVTASAGVSSGDPKHVEDVNAAADAALYRAKTGGRNRISQ
jgi:diguanylate cyclase (GGDEF)-like protein